MESIITITQKEYPLSYLILVGFLKDKQGYVIKSRTNETVWGITYVLEKEKSKERLYTLEEMKKAFELGRERITHPDWDYVYEEFDEFLKTL